jgi:hypothetical protein
MFFFFYHGVKKHLNYILKQTSKKNNMMSGTEFSGLASELTMFTSGLTRRFTAEEVCCLFSSSTKAVSI